ncbi:MAG: IS1/IS1595 family N-terminal zinc-binding domain-containing protein [Phormidesmis sp.]
MKQNTNPPCPDCAGAAKKNGRYKGQQKYVCKVCNRTFTGNKIGRPTVGEKPMTGAERAKRAYRKKKSEGG